MRGALARSHLAGAGVSSALQAARVCVLTHLLVACWTPWSQLAFLVTVFKFVYTFQVTKTMEAFLLCL